MALSEKTHCLDHSGIEACRITTNERIASMEEKIDRLDKKFDRHAENIETKINEFTKSVDAALNGTGGICERLSRHDTVLAWSRRVLYAMGMACGIIAGAYSDKIMIALEWFFKRTTP